MISLVSAVADAVLTSLSAVAVKVTPKPHKRIAWALFAEFCVFVGLSYYMAAKGVVAEEVIYAIRALLYSCFILVFAIVQSKYLTIISGLIALYQVLGAFFSHTVFFSEIVYFSVMLTFCIAQLGCLLPGVFNGNRFKRWKTSDDRRGVTRHHYSG